MGLNIELQDERGLALTSLADSQNVLRSLLPDDEVLHPLLASIDLYGDTVFNRIQMERFLREWSEVSARTQSDEGSAFCAAIESMATRCRDDVHLYLKFIVD